MGFGDESLNHFVDFYLFLCEIFAKTIKFIICISFL